MPRKARLDAEGAIHHLIVRGIEQRRIFDDDGDRRQFISRLATVAVETGTAIYAWALLPNHAHALIRSGPPGISKFMRRLLTGYAVYYNRRHDRQGYLFQNRYKSILCEEEAYFRELIRYIHLNPLRAGLVDGLVELDTYPWCGHAFIVNGSEYPWHDVSFVLSRFGEKRGEARRQYREFLERGIQEEAAGGKKRQWRSDWSLLDWLKNLVPVDDREKTGADGRVLGGEKFISRMGRGRERSADRRAASPEELIQSACRQSGFTIGALLSGNRCAELAELRASLARQLIHYPGMTLTRIGELIGISKSGVSRVLSRKA
ncbi:MAG: Transposase IS200 like protein [Syntrophaceae bacterium PtaU1.Bin231]|nr:MAG: Transposase IS200 like protein [Syntrophaceae bacterium PtaU1.Bin231]